jgi:hypothetical protein
MHAQQAKPAVPPVGPTVLPDAPSPTPAANTADVPADELQDKRTLGIMPNFRTVSPGEFVLSPTVHEKWVTATEDNFDYSALIFGGIIAADAFAGKETPEFHQGAAGYARYYWHTVADQSIQNYFVEFIIPAIGHEDSRYYAMGKDNGGFFKRVGYALSRGVVTRSDAGKPMFNYAQILGSGAAVAISNFYYPAPERTVANGFRNLGQDIGYDSMTFLFHEFWPDISHAVLHSKADVKPSRASQ